MGGEQVGSGLRQVRVGAPKWSWGPQELPTPLQAPPLGAGGGTLLPGAVELPQPQFISRFLEGQSGVTIKHVACGDLFTACLTGNLVRGVLCTDKRKPNSATSLISNSLINISLS